MNAARPLDIVVFGLSITSAWGNGHATTYRALARALADRGHRVRFFERDAQWYASNRDLPHPPYCGVQLYSNVASLEEFFPGEITADLVVLGSFVPQGALLAEWVLPRASGVTAFYDIDTPVTVAKLKGDGCDYLTPALIPRFDLYLSFAGGPILRRLYTEWGAARPRPLLCSVDPRDYYPLPGVRKQYDLGYLGTYSVDRQPALERLLIEPARRWAAGSFCVAGAQYPQSVRWPSNVVRADHLPPSTHRLFYNSQRATLNITRADMIASGYSPSVRLFEAAACGVPIISDEWPGLEEFFTPGREILVASTTEEISMYLREMNCDDLQQVGATARKRVLAAHTAEHRARELESHVSEVHRLQPPLDLDAYWTGSVVSALELS